MTLLTGPTTKTSGVDAAPARRPLADRLTAAMPILAAVMTMLVFAPFAALEIPLDAPLWLKPAVDVLSGQVLFRDTMSGHGLLHVYIEAAFVALLGPKLISLTIGAVVMYGVTAGFLAAAWGRLLPPPLTALSLLLWWSLAHFLCDSPMDPHPSVDCLMFQAAALYFLLKSTPAAGVRSLVYPLLCGVSAGLCFWCRFHIALPLIAAVGVSYLILACAAGERPLASRRLYAFVVGNLAVHLAFLAVLVSMGAMSDCIEQYLIWFKYNSKGVFSTVWALFRCMLIPPAFRGSLRSDPVRALLPLIPILGGIAALALGFMAMIPAGAAEAAPDRGAGPTRKRPLAPAVSLMVLGFSVLMVMLCQPMSEAMIRSFNYRFMPREYWYFVVPCVVLAAMAAVSANWLLRRLRGGGNLLSEPILSGYLAGLVALASWTQYAPYGDNVHGWWALTPGIGVFAFFVLRLAPRRPLAITLALGALMMPTVLQRSVLAVERLLQPRITLQSPPAFSGLRLQPQEAAALTPFLAVLDDYIAKHPKTAMLIDGGPAAIYLPLVPDLSNASNIWFYDRSFPIPRPEEVEARRREFIRDRKPLLAYYFEDAPSRFEHPTRYELEEQQKHIGVNRDRRANMEEILRNDHYVELAQARVAEGQASLILLGPRD